MNSITYFTHAFPKKCERGYTSREVRHGYLSGIESKKNYSSGGTFFDELFDELVFRLCGKSRKSRAVFKMGIPKFVQQLELQQVIKYGIVAYVVAAILSVPSGICSQAYRPFNYVLPVIASAAPFQESAEAARTDIRPVGDTLSDDSDPEIPFYDHILQAAQTYQVDATLIQAIIMAESRYNPRAVSHRGAQGLMQLMPTTAKWLGVEDSFDPALNIDGGVRYFKKLLDRFGGNVRLALAAYNAGSRYVHKYRGVPPFRATRIYIKKVLNYHRLFREQALSAQDGLTTS